MKQQIYWFHSWSERIIIFGVAILSDYLVDFIGKSSRFFVAAALFGGIFIYYVIYVKIDFYAGYQ